MIIDRNSLLLVIKSAIWKWRIQPPKIKRLLWRRHHKTNFRKNICARKTWYSNAMYLLNFLCKRRKKLVTLFISLQRRKYYSGGLKTTWNTSINLKLALFFMLWGDKYDITRSELNACGMAAILVSVPILSHVWRDALE